METYNKVMMYFWAAMTVVLFVTITFMGFKEGFNRWSMYYIMPVITLFILLVRRLMMKRMKKHKEYLEDQKKE